MTNTIDENNMEEIKSCCGGGNKNQEGSCCSGEEQSCNCGNDHEDEKGSCCSGEENSCNCGHDHDDHDHHHGHDHEHEHAHMVTFENEDGTTQEYPIVDEFELEGVVYILVMNEDETVTPLKVAGDDGELVFLTEEEFHTVSEAYEALSESDELQ